jgi:hypothetical protein
MGCWRGYMPKGGTEYCAVLHTGGCVLCIERDTADDHRGGRIRGPHICLLAGLRAEKHADSGRCTARTAVGQYTLPYGACMYCTRALLVFYLLVSLALRAPMVFHNISAAKASPNTWNIYK